MTEFLRVGVFWVALVLVVDSCCAFTATPSANTAVRRPLRATATSSSSSSAAAAAAAMPGVAEFESWISKLDGAYVDVNVKHSMFDGCLRGLKWTGTTTVSSPTKIATIPASVVLSSDFKQENWDRDLALELCKSCRTSPDNGYCRLLTEGTDWNDHATPPPSTAPHSLRYWSKEQKELLSLTLAGEALIDLEQRQEAAWRQKYDASGVTQDEVSWPQFAWAMEAVHSRAFCGVQTSAATSNLLLSILAPILAAIIGYVYATTSIFPSEAILTGLAFVALLPTALSLVRQEDASSAVMLPLIDSANHLETADSRIDYDPVKRCFELTVGPGCFLDNDDTRQLYISYGKKKDSELLLNYGFLPGVKMSENQDEYRRNLAQVFQKRNS